MDAEIRLKSQWVTAVLLCLLPIGLVLAVLPNFIAPLTRPLWEHSELAVSAILALVFGPLYYLSRRGYYKSVASIAVAAGIIAIWISILQDSDLMGKTFDTAMLVMPLLFISVIFSRKATLLVGGAILLSLLPLPLFTSAFSYADIFSGPFNIILVGTGLSIFGASFRGMLERHHTNALTTTNAALYAEIAERRRIEEELKKVVRDKIALVEAGEVALQEKEILLKEIHHRVKNNLQVISSLLSLQAGKLQDPRLVAQYQDSQNRIRSMALIHEQLYRSDDLAQIDFGAYLRELSYSLLQTYRKPTQDVRINIETDVVMLDIETAIPCGLLVNELASNALKHAFPDDREGVIDIEMRQPTPGHFQLTVRDNGIGFPVDLNFRKTKSLGLELVTSLARQLGGDVELQNGTGAAITLSFGQAAPSIVRPIAGQVVQQSIP
jgi:two-component sensor histidine kinase